MTDEQRRILEEHADILDRVQAIFREYEPTKRMTTFEALITIAKEVQNVPANAVVGEIEKRVTEHAELLKKMPVCSCRKCVAEAGLEDVSDNKLQYAQFLGHLERTMKEINPKRFRGFCFVIAEEHENSPGTHTWSSMSGITRRDMQTLIGSAGIDFLIHYEPRLSDDGKMQILLGAVEDAKAGDKWVRYQVSKGLQEKFERGRGGSLGDILGMGEPDFAKKLREMMEKGKKNDPANPPAKGEDAPADSPAKSESAQ